jgi:hypothetical protein
MKRQIQRAIEHGLQAGRYSERTRIAIAFFLFASASLAVGCFVVRTTKADYVTQVVAEPSGNGVDHWTLPAVSIFSPLVTVTVISGTRTSVPDSRTRCG